MSLFKQLAKLWYILPVAIISIVILDLVRNRSLVTQYLHWTVYAVVGTTAAIFTGNMQSFYITIMHSFEFEVSLSFPLQTSKCTFMFRPDA